MFTSRQSNIQEDLDLQQHCCENHKTCKLQMCVLVMKMDDTLLDRRGNLIVSSVNALSVSVLNVVMKLNEMSWDKLTLLPQN